MYSFDFLKMHPDKSFVQGGVPLGTYARGMSEPGKQYAYYHHHSTFGRNTASYKVTPGNYQEDAGAASARGVVSGGLGERGDGRSGSTEKLASDGGSRTVKTPAHVVDIALRVKRT